MLGQPDNQTEYKGPVGFEKKDHKTHFEAVPELRKTDYDSGYEWVKTSLNRWIRVQKRPKDGDNIIHSTS